MVVISDCINADKLQDIRGHKAMLNIIKMLRCVLAFGLLAAYSLNAAAQTCPYTCQSYNPASKSCAGAASNLCPIITSALANTCPAGQTLGCASHGHTPPGVASTRFVYDTPSAKCIAVDGGGKIVPGYLGIPRCTVQSTCAAGTQGFDGMGNCLACAPGLKLANGQCR